MNVDTFNTTTITSEQPVTERTAAARAARVMIVDDEPLNVVVTRKLLERVGYSSFVEVTDSSSAIARLYAETPDVVLLDLAMPRVSGLEVLEAIRADAALQYLPVLILTASNDPQTKAEALNAGATDFLAKPVDAVELVARVRNALLIKSRQDELERLIQERTADVEWSRREVIFCLARAAEFRDNDTGRHVVRVGKYVGILARELGMGDADVTMLELASTLHDVGKIGIPDSILLKPGKLEPDELLRMKGHADIGNTIVSPMSADELKAFADHAVVGSALIGQCTSPLLIMASEIALSHHERWDGGGYPRGLEGEAIPLSGRITAVADVFDALSSRRPYKEPFALDKCLTILGEGRGTQFDPAVLDAFDRRREAIIAVKDTYAD
ncbi:MAG: HD domain-containing phosphohydrolase [Lacipirellulaceae bacterium]